MIFLSTALLLFALPLPQTSFCVPPSTLQACGDALPPEGGTIFLAPNTKLIVRTETSWDKPVCVIGAGNTSVLELTPGIVGIHLKASGSCLERLLISAPTADDSTIAVLLSNGEKGLNDWHITDVFIESDTQKKLGIGIKGHFALKGTITGGEIHGWKTGVLLEDNSNANYFAGCKIRENEDGLFTNADSYMDAYMNGCTVEGNHIGVHWASKYLFSAFGNHFENNAEKDPVNVLLENGMYSGHGNSFGEASPFGDLVIAGSGQDSSSFDDHFNAGITVRSGRLLRFGCSTVPSRGTIICR